MSCIPSRKRPAVYGLLIRFVIIIVIISTFLLRRIVYVRQSRGWEREEREREEQEGGGGERERELELKNLNNQG